MRVLGVVWVGTRTAAFQPTFDFFRRVLGIDLELVDTDFGWSRLPNTSQFEIFGPSDRDHLDFTTGPVPEFLVDDISGALAELQAAGVIVLSWMLQGVSGRQGRHQPPCAVPPCSAAANRRMSAADQSPVSDPQKQARVLVTLLTSTAT
jgi:hypothetical protein